MNRQSAHLQALPLFRHTRLRMAGVAAVVLAAHLAALWALHQPNPTRPPQQSTPSEVLVEVVLTPQPKPAEAAPAPQPPVPKAPPLANPGASSTTAQKPTPRPDPLGPSPTSAQAPLATPLTAPPNTATEQGGSAPTPAPESVAASATVASPVPAHPPVGVATQAAAQALRPAPTQPSPALIEPPSSQAEYLDNPPPPYPRLSRRLGEQGKVVVRVLIGTHGRAEQAQIHSSSGHERLDQTALATVLGWRYVPGKRNGVAEAMWFNVPIQFVLE